MAKFSNEEKAKFQQMYRAMPAALPVSAIATQFQVAANTLRGWIREGGWERDLSDEVRRRTNSAVIKAGLAGPEDRPLTDEEEIMSQRVAINLALIEGHQDFLRVFGNTLVAINGHLSGQVKDLLVPVMNKDTGEYEMKPLSLNNAIGQSRQLIAAFSDMATEQRRAFGISEDGKPDEVDADTLLRQLAEEVNEIKAAEKAAQEEAEAAETEGL
ncbi:MAG: hypothetical protein K2W88_00125 [Pararheinheimera sp.]|nr:hypothetical protein [Rheinheimera sp.]